MSCVVSSSIKRQEIPMARIYTLFHSILLASEPSTYRFGNFLVSNLPLLALLLLVHNRIAQRVIR